MLISIPAGLLLGYLLNEGPAPVRWPIVVVTQIGRGFPALVTLYLIYFGLPEFHLTLSAAAALIAAFSLTTASYLAEVFRSALAAVPKGQREATLALGVPGWSRMMFVIVPQAVKMVVTPVIGFAALVLQGTSLAYSIGVRELLGVSYSEGTVTFSVFDYLVLAGAFYLAAYLVLTWAAAAVRRRTVGQPARQTVRILD
jgi:polar amino acid transport system permease protein